MEPGDILLTNDAYTTGSHLNHMTFSVPIFHDGKVVAFSCCMAHWTDVGGTLQRRHHRHLRRRAADCRSSRPIATARPTEELIDIIRMNVRLPDRAMGDLRAQVAAVRTGEKPLPAK